jgi:type I restriction enzyme, S subunit
VTAEFEGANCHALIVASPVTEVVCSEYLAWVLYSNYGVHVLKSIQTGALHPHLNCGNVKDVWLPLPPMVAQRAIVAHVDRTVVEHNRAIHMAEKAIELLDEHRTSLIAAAVTGKIDVRAHPTDAVEAAD